MDSVTKWECTVCGYIVEGEQAPESCPVCGAGKDFFKEIIEKEWEEKTDPIGWKCLICGYECSDVPDSCPVCAAGSDQFIAQYPSENTTKSNDLSDNTKIVIIGSGVAAFSAVQAIREAGSHAEVVIITNDIKLPYYRLNLTRYLAGEIDSSLLPMKPDLWYEEHNIDVKLNREVIAIDKVKKCVRLKGGEEESFSKLIIATGAHPFMPPFKGNDKANISMVRTIEDVEVLLEKTKVCESFVVIGGGVLGLEVAGALAQKNIKVTLIEGYDWLLPRQLNKKAGLLLQNSAEEKGISFIKNSRIEKFLGEGSADSVKFTNGEKLSAGHFIVTTGVRPTLFLAQQESLKIDRGIVVDDYMVTSEPDIYAAGDVCQHRGVLYGTWAPAQYQGRIAGLNAIGERINFEGVPRSNILKVLGVEMFSIGEFEVKDASYHKVEFQENQNYYLFVFKDEKLVGSILLGDSSLSSNISTVISDNINCESLVINEDSFEVFCKFFEKI